MIFPLDPLVPGVIHIFPLILASNKRSRKGKFIVINGVLLFILKALWKRVIPWDEELMIN